MGSGNLEPNPLGLGSFGTGLTLAEPTALTRLPPEPGPNLARSHLGQAPVPKESKGERGVMSYTGVESPWGVGGGGISHDGVGDRWGGGCQIAGGSI